MATTAQDTTTATTGAAPEATEQRRAAGQLALLALGAPARLRGSATRDRRNPDDEAWDAAYYGAHGDGGAP